MKKREIASIHNIGAMRTGSLKMLYLLLWLSFYLFPSTIFAQKLADNLDLGFGEDGIVNMPYDKINWGQADRIHSIALQSDGKIITGWDGADLTFTFRGGVIRFNSNGTVDSCFGTNGKAHSPIGIISKVIVLPNDKILAISNFSVARFLKNGQLDTDFNGTGFVKDLAPGTSTDAAVLPIGKLIIAGEAGNFGRAIQVKTNGTLDSSFSKDGIADFSYSQWSTSFRAIRVTSNGKILLGGTANNSYLKYLLVQLLPNGNLDSTGFGIDGEAVSNGIPGSISDIDIQPNGKIIVTGGDVFQGSITAMYLPNGTLDKNFWGDGVFNLPVDVFGNKDTLSTKRVIVAPDDKIYLAGWSYFYKHGTPFVIRLNKDGSVDNSYASFGLAIFLDKNSGISSFLLQQDGKLLCGGVYVANKNDGIETGILIRHNLFPLRIESKTTSTKDILFPNPTTKLLYVASLWNGATYTIIDAVGHTHQKGILNKYIDVSKLPIGHYFLQLNTEKRNTIRQFSKL